MTNPSSITAWLDHLQALLPPSAITLVGAGKGTGTWAQWLLHEVKGARVTLIEAEPLQFATLQRTLNALGESAQHCEIRNTLVAAQQGTTPFFVASSQQESGLLQPQWLLNLWPNLQTKEVRDLNAITLDTLLGNLGGDVEQSMGQGHWLILDCLPAGELLRTSSKLDQVDVVIARVLWDEPHSVPAGASQKEVSEFLQQNGMVQVAVDTTRHPGIGYALFVRDTRSALRAQVQKHHAESQKLRLSGEEQAKLLQEFQAQVGQLTQTKVAAEKRSQELTQQMEQLGQALEKQKLLAQERLSQVEQLAQAKLIVETQSRERVLQLELLTKARDEQAKLAQERHAQIEQLTQAKAAAEKQSQERAQQLEQLTKARDEQAKLAQERLVQTEQLTQAKAAAEKQSQEKEGDKSSELKSQVLRSPGGALNSEKNSKNDWRNNYKNIYPLKKKGWVAVISLWKREDYLREQLEAICNQSVPPSEIVLIQNENNFEIDKSLREKFDFKLIKSEINTLYLRFILSYIFDFEYACFFDDDVIPGENWIKSCYEKSVKYNAIIGPSGRIANASGNPKWINVDPKQDIRLNFTVSCGESDVICDWVCNSYFMKTEWIKYFVNYQRYNLSHLNLEDMQLAFSVFSASGIRCVVPMQPKDDFSLHGHSKRQFGHDDKALWRRGNHLPERENYLNLVNEAGYPWPSRSGKI